MLPPASLLPRNRTPCGRMTAPFPLLLSEAPMAVSEVSGFVWPHAASQ